GPFTRGALVTSHRVFLRHSPHASFADFAKLSDADDHLLARCLKGEIAHVVGILRCQYVDALAVVEHDAETVHHHRHRVHSYLAHRSTASADARSRSLP